mmetsp:Transcript_109801/g.321517  ORF Transcript_109801/g.321517 Transcript_109801/m.321517 type:complete len:185 (+) Transcript_109801:97-651(+)
MQATLEMLNGKQKQTHKPSRWQLSEITLAVPIVAHPLQSTQPGCFAFGCSCGSHGCFSFLLTLKGRVTWHCEWQHGVPTSNTSATCRSHELGLKIEKPPPELGIKESPPKCHAKGTSELLEVATGCLKVLNAATCCNLRAQPQLPNSAAGNFLATSHGISVAGPLEVLLATVPVFCRVFEAPSS